MKKILFSSMLVGALALPSLAFAAQDTAKPMPTHGEVHSAKYLSKGDMPDGPKGAKASRTMRMAEQLAAIETAIGIKSEQLNSWRAYSAAMINLMPQPPRLGEERAAPKETIPGEWRANRMIEQAEKAQLFKKAAADLRQELSPEQIARLNSFANKLRDEHGGRAGPHNAKHKGENPAKTEGKMHDSAKKPASRS